VRDSCLDDVDTCDLYVLILGHRYGFQPVEGNPEKLSITHLEFRRAGQSGIPRIVLLRTSLPDTRLSDLEDSQRAPLVLAFRAEVQREVRPAQFSDLTGLIQGLSTGVQSELDKLRALSEHRTEAWLAAHLQDVAKQFESHMAASALKSGTRPEELYLDLVVAERHLGKKEEASPEELISALVSLWGSHTAVSKLVEGSREKRWYLGNLTPELAPQLKLGKLSEAVKAEIERLGCGRICGLMGVKATVTLPSGFWSLHLGARSEHCISFECLLRVWSSMTAMLLSGLSKRLPTSRVRLLSPHCNVPSSTTT